MWYKGNESVFIPLIYSFWLWQWKPNDFSRPVHILKMLINSKLREVTMSNTVTLHLSLFIFIFLTLWWTATTESWMIHDERAEMNPPSLMKPLLISHCRDSLPLLSCAQPQVPTFNLDAHLLETRPLRPPEYLHKIHQRNADEHEPFHFCKWLKFKQTIINKQA